MQDCDAQPSQELLKELRRKAELCRFAHSKLRAKNRGWRNGKEFSIVLLSVILSGLIGAYYRKVWEGELILLFIFVAPSVITLMQALDHMVFQWTHKFTRHESAVAIWGDWIREADFLEKHIHQYTSDLVGEKMRNIEDKYVGCMAHTEQIPNSKFLKYKRAFREYVLKSKEIDTMSLSDINRRT